MFSFSNIGKNDGKLPIGRTKGEYIEITLQLGTEIFKMNRLTT